MRQSLQNFIRICVDRQSYFVIPSFNVSFLFALIAIFFQSPSPSFAGAWVLPCGSELQSFSFLSYSSTEYFDGSSHARDAGASFRKVELVTERQKGFKQFEAGMETRMARIDRQLDNQRFVSLLANQVTMADNSFYIKKPILLSSDWITSLQGTIGLPTAYSASSGNGIAYGQSFIESRALAGRNFTLSPDWQSYMNAELAGRLYATGGAALIASSAYGVKYHDKWEIYTMLSQEVETQTALIGLDGKAYENRYNLTKFQAGVIYTINTHYRAELSGMDDLMGKHTGNGQTIMLRVIRLL